MISRSLTMRVLLICNLIAMLSTGCGGRSGEITGHIIGTETGQPLVNTQIILCQLSSEISGCTMQSAPTTRSDASGAFTLSDVSPGSYVLLYGMPDELV
jgi:5-hydroxyisourate hydrolase-like protein (transthyretin family)